MVKITDDIDGYIRGAGTKYEELKTALTEKSIKTMYFNYLKLGILIKRKSTL